jgi:hypothetical protein
MPLRGCEDLDIEQVGDMATKDVGSLMATTKRNRRMFVCLEFHAPGNSDRSTACSNLFCCAQPILHAAHFQLSLLWGIQSNQSLRQRLPGIGSTPIPTDAAQMARRAGPDRVQSRFSARSLRAITSHACRPACGGCRCGDSRPSAVRAADRDIRACLR